MSLAYAAMQVEGSYRSTHPAILASPYKVGFASAARDFIRLLRILSGRNEHQIPEDSAYKAADTDPVWVHFTA